jgi:hypothetical protein
MIKRQPKTDEQLYIDWASTDPDWLENSPLNKTNLEFFKKTMADVMVMGLNPSDKTFLAEVEL